MKNNKITESPYFKYIIIVGILFVPFLYSFFYLKAYWDPYGKGNMDNIPVAIVNNDKGVRGKTLTNKLIKRKALKFTKENKSQAQIGLNNKKYYAVITIPESFTKNMESAKEEDKTPATITYSPNQKTNYLASQIISRVLLTVEKEVRSEVSESVVKTLSDKVKEVPEKLNEIEKGTEKLEEGGIKLNDGLNTLSNKYTEFDNGVNKAYEGSQKLNNGLGQINNGMNNLLDGSNNLNNGVKKINEALASSNTDNITALTEGISALNDGSSTLNSSINSYVTGTENLAGGVLSLNSTLNYMKSQYQNLINTSTSDLEKSQYTAALSAINQILDNSGYNNLVSGSNSILDTNTYGVTKGSLVKQGSNNISNGIKNLNNSTSQIQSVGTSINLLKSNLAKVQNGTSDLVNGVSTLKSGNNQILNGSTELETGLSTLRNSSSSVKEGINNLSTGSTELRSGITTLKEAVKKGNEEGKEELKKLDGLDKFAANPVKLAEKDVNKVDSYGTAFAPFFMSIALWVGSLMLFIILYYDANDRFKLLSRNANDKLKRTMCYLALAVFQGITLGVALLIGLDLRITNYLLYFISLILVSCLFESIMEALIINFGDIGKFLALIILVLQLAAAGGTFPIETVTKSFRWLNNLLPMKYTCDLFKETVISIEGNLLSKSLLIIIISLGALLSLNIYKDKTKVK